MIGFEGTVFTTFLERWHKMPDEVRSQSLGDVLIVMKRLEYDRELEHELAAKQKAKREIAEHEIASKAKLNDLIRSMQRG